MLGIRVNKKGAEAVKAYLKAHKLLDKQHYVFSRGAFIYFPILPLDEQVERKVRLIGGTLTKAAFRRSSRSPDYRTLLLKRIGKKGYEDAIKSFDLIGNTAIIGSQPSTERAIAEAIMDANPKVTRVISKAGAVSGRYRTRNFHHVAGERGYSVTYAENNIRISMDIRKAFFSPRLAYERKRISDLAKDGEAVVVMFAGVGPFAILLAKEHPHSKVVAIELNMEAYKYMLDNVTLNKALNVTPLHGDVRRFSKKYGGFADRILMPLPKDSHDFIDVANSMSADRCVIHYYAFGPKLNPYSKPMSDIKSFFAAKGKRVKFLFKRVVRQYSPTDVEIVLDFEISSKRKARRDQLR